MVSLKISSFLLILLINYSRGYDRQYNDLESTSEKIMVALEPKFCSSSQKSLICISAEFKKPVKIYSEKIRMINGIIEDVVQKSPKSCIITVRVINQYEFGKLIVLEGFGVSDDKSYSQKTNFLIEPIKIDKGLLDSKLNVSMNVDSTASNKQLPYPVKLTFSPPLLNDFKTDDLILNNIIVATIVCNSNKTECKIYVIPHSGDSNSNKITLKANSLVSIYNTTNTEAISTKVVFNKNNINKYIIYQKTNGKFDMFTDIWEDRTNNKVFNAIFEVPCIDTKYIGLLEDPVNTTNYYYFKVTPSGLYLNKMVDGIDKTLKSMGLRCQVDRVPFWIKVDRSDDKIVKILFGNSNKIGESRLIYYEDNDYSSISDTKYLTFANTNITTIISYIKVNCPLHNHRECNNNGRCLNTLQCQCSLFYTGIACESIDVLEVVLPIVSLLIIVGSAIGLYLTRDKWMYLITGDNDEEDRETETGNELSLIENEM